MDGNELNSEASLETILDATVKDKSDDDMRRNEFSRTKAHLASFLTGVLSALDETEFDGADAKAPCARSATPQRPSEPHEGSGVGVGDHSGAQPNTPRSTINIHIGSLSNNTNQTASEKVTSSLAALRTRLDAIQDEVDVRKAMTNIVKLKGTVLSSRVRQLSASPTAEELKEYDDVLSGYRARLQDLFFDNSLLSHEVAAAKTALQALQLAMSQCERECNDHRSDKAYLKELLDMRSDQISTQARIIAERDEKLKSIKKEYEIEVWKLKDRHAAELNGYKKGQATLQRKLWEKENPGKTLPIGFMQNRPLTK